MKLFKSAVLFLVLIPASILATSCAQDSSSANNDDSQASNNSNNSQASNSSNNCITEKDVIDAQNTWANAIVEIGKTYKNKGDYKTVAANTVDNLYGYDEGKVLFKPTKASEGQFRLTEEDALSYFVKGKIAEDDGFALQTWSKVRFENAGVSIGCSDAVAMGNYYFTDSNTGKETKVEYTFGYRRNSDGKLLIDLHHSSLPFNPT
ncbi:hypothetical protein NIES267_45220 [Calothrix parasitica NIES-267]|uniref:Phosphoribosyl-AMP cyclohydrolase n=1 Tax=Calothrix parasitica NIES-267 TaxID=1973488 RepID=A0A1Z4LV20_9CYAN|nr:hypothetical protein NIES267_45220 [Calothrix parasitica NIES-267]